MSQRFIVHPTHPQIRLVRQAVALLRAGGVIVYPTDSCYALGCGLDAFDAAARIRAIRGIDDRHHLTLVCHDLAQAGRYARLDNWQFRVVRQGVPGSYTFLLPATREVPRRLQNPKRRTIGIRVPAHPVPLAIVGALGEPLMSSTLILPDDAIPLNDPEQIHARLRGQVDLLIESGNCSIEPTSVIDLTAGFPRVLREGRGDVAAFA